MNNKQKKIVQMGNRCEYCGSTHKLTVDHIIPRSLGRTLGLDVNSKENLQVLCESCNRLKGHALKSNCPKTTRLVKKAFDRWLFLHGTKDSRRKYVFRTLPIKSLTPHPTYLFACDRICQLKLIYQKQHKT